MGDKMNQMDVSGPKSQLAEKWRVWLRNFTFFAEGKANLNNVERKKNELLFRAGPGVQDIFENLTEVPAAEDAVDNNYLACVRTLNNYFHVEENVAYERHVLRQLKQEAGEDVDSFVLRLRKQARHCGYDEGAAGDAVRDQLLEKVGSPELRTKLFEVPNIQLQQALATARAWETARLQASKVVVDAREESINAVFGRRKEKETKDKAAVKCFSCGRKGHYSRDPKCPAKGQTCAKCGGKNHWAACCKSKADGFQRKEGSKQRTFQRNNQRVNQVECEEALEPFASPVIFSHSMQDNVVSVKINGTSVDMLVDSGAQVTVMGETEFEKLKSKGLKVNLEVENRKLRVYGDGRIPIVGSANVLIGFGGKEVAERVIIVSGTGHCLLSSQAAKSLGLLRVGAEVCFVGSSMEDIVQKFPTVFTGVGKLADYKLKIHIDPNVVPVAQKPRRIPYPLKDRVLKKISELESLDIIEKVTGPTSWVSPAVFAPKPNKDDIRICVDMRCANQAILREKLPMSTVDDVLEEMNGSSVFSKLDLKLGFHQVELDESSRDITTFAVGDSLYRYKRLSFGISSAPEKYHNIIRQSICDIPGVTSIADDIVVHGKSVEEHDRSLYMLLKRLEEKKLTVKQDKCKIGMNEIQFMGLIINKHGIGPTEEKAKAIKGAKEPSTISELKSFLGLASFCSRFIPDFATIAEPLRKLTRQGTEWKWGSREQEAFDILKDKVGNASMMAFFDKNAQTEIWTDASQVGLGAILVQEQNGVKRAVCFASRSLSDVERRYSQTEKEALAVVWGCERFHLYLYGLEEFTLVTDCKALEAIYSVKSKPSARIERWVLRLMPFKFKVHHVSSTQNIADCLSRLNKIPALSHEGEETEEYIRAVAVIATPQAMNTREIERESAADHDLSVVRRCWRSGNWNNVPREYSLIRNEITLIGNLVMRGVRIIVPKKLRERVLQLAHEGHQGVVKTKDRLRAKVWWPGINNEVERFCRRCHGCQANTPSTTQPLVKSTMMPLKPWRDLALDLLGPLPKGEYLLVTVDYYSRWMEVDVLKNTNSEAVIKCVENHFTRHGLPKTLKTDNATNLVSKEMEVFLTEHGVEHKRVIPLWPRANGEVERQNRTLLKALRVAQTEGKDWKKELFKFLIAYRSTPHSTTGVSPAKLMFNREIRTKLPVFEDYEEEDETQMSEARDTDAQRKQRYSDNANKRAQDSHIEEGDKVLLKRDKENKLSSFYDPDPFKVLARKGDMLIVERGNILYKRNVDHVKHFMQSEIPAENQVEREIEVLQPDRVELRERQREIIEPMRIEHRLEEPPRAEIRSEIIEPLRADQRPKESRETEPQEQIESNITTDKTVDIQPLRRSCRVRKKPEWFTSK